MKPIDDRLGQNLTSAQTPAYLLLLGEDMAPRWLWAAMCRNPAPNIIVEWLWAL
jgi:hypothetical protein